MQRVKKSLSVTINLEHLSILFDIIKIKNIRWRRLKNIVLINCQINPCLAKQLNKVTLHAG